ncbi:MAG: helix-turn-helix domain-containing protein [Defluviicoccus sp.]
MTERVAYSPEEVAIVCGIGRTLVYDHIKQGKLKKIKVGRRTLITADEVQRWLKSLQAA